MATAKKRILVSLSDPVERALELLAKRDRTPQATIASRLLEAALEAEEDQIWDSVAAERDTQDARFVPHSQAWA